MSPNTDVIWLLSKAQHMCIAIKLLIINNNLKQITFPTILG